MGHRAEMQQREKMADAQPLDAVDQLIADRLGAPGDQKAALDEILVFERAQIETFAQRRLEGPHRREEGSSQKTLRWSERGSNRWSPLAWNPPVRASGPLPQLYGVRPMYRDRAAAALPEACRRSIHLLDLATPLRQVASERTMKQ